MKKYYNLAIINHQAFIEKEGFPFVFVPRIPSDRMEGENKNIPRICLSPTIEGCIRALPGTYQAMECEDFFFEYKYEWGNQEGLIFAVNEFEIDENDDALIPNEYVAFEGNVEDALKTGEVWYTKPLFATDQYYIFVINTESVYWDMDITDYEKISRFYKSNSTPIIIPD